MINSRIMRGIGLLKKKWPSALRDLRMFQTMSIDFCRYEGDVLSVFFSDTEHGAELLGIKQEELVYYGFLPKYPNNHYADMRKCQRRFTEKWKAHIKKAREELKKEDMKERGLIYERRVAWGAKMLDGVCPGWARRAHLRPTPGLSRQDDVSLGKSTGGYYRFEHGLVNRSTTNLQIYTENGFDGNDNTEIANLEIKWREEILGRRMAK